jgi:hypothetical protein
MQQEGSDAVAVRRGRHWWQHLRAVVAIASLATAAVGVPSIPRTAAGAAVGAAETGQSGARQSGARQSRPRPSIAAPLVAEVARVGAEARRPALAALFAEARRRHAGAVYAATLFGALVERARSEEQARDAIWDRLAQCETGGNWSMRGAWYSGGVGFFNRTWDAYGGRKFAPNAGMATRDEQIVVAERVRASNGGSLFGAWGCAPAAER